MARKRKPVKKQRRVVPKKTPCCVPLLERPAAGLFSHVRCARHTPHGTWTQPPKAAWPSLLPTTELPQLNEEAEGTLVSYQRANAPLR